MSDPAAAKILLVDDDESLGRVTGYHLEQAGYGVRTVTAPDAALRALAEHDVDLLITDVRMPGMDGLELLTRVKARWPQVGVVVITAHGTVEDAVHAIRSGAHDYLVKPFEHDALLLTVEKCLRLQALERENRRLRELATQRLDFENLVATSSVMTELLEQAASVALRDTTVLLLGESGTGKELVARAIHHASPRASKPFVAVNLSAVPEGLIDSELFGHEKGAFTGATAPHRGWFERAHGGTLFLDEIGDLHLPLQTKLLRALQEGEIQKLGATRTHAVNVRVIAATNRDLEAQVQAGEFRQDLYYRLCVVPLHLPPLRARRDDIPPLIEHVLRRLDAAGEISPEAIEVMRRYDWPGNVRELENVLERAIVLRRGPRVEVEHLPERLREPSDRVATLLGDLPEDGISLEAVERELLERALRKCGGNQSRAARYLGITRNTLLYRLEKHKIGRSAKES